MVIEHAQTSSPGNIKRWTEAYESVLKVAWEARGGERRGGGGGDSDIGLLTSSVNEAPNSLPWLQCEESLTGIQKGMLLTLHDTSPCRENTGRTWMHRFNYEGMQNCMGESSKRLASWSSGQRLGQEEGWMLEFWNHVWINTKLKSEDVNYLQIHHISSCSLRRVLIVWATIKTKHSKALREL